MRPRFPTRVRLRTPTAPSKDPLSGNDVPGPVVESSTRAYLAQRSVTDRSLAIENTAGQDTIASLWTLLVPANTLITARTQVIDDDDAVYEIQGDPAPRRAPRSQRVVYIAAALRRTSDLQGVG